MQVSALTFDIGEKQSSKQDSTTHVTQMFGCRAPIPAIIHNNCMLAMLATELLHQHTEEPSKYDV